MRIIVFYTKKWFRVIDLWNWNYFLFCPRSGYEKSWKKTSQRLSAIDSLYLLFRPIELLRSFPITSIRPTRQNARDSSINHRRFWHGEAYRWPRSWMKLYEPCTCPSTFLQRNEIMQQLICYKVSSSWTLFRKRGVIFMNRRIEEKCRTINNGGKSMDIQAFLIVLRSRGIIVFLHVVRRKHDAVMRSYTLAG